MGGRRGGRSPRGRGRQPDLPPRVDQAGSIPAWAGETTVHLTKPVAYKVDPRVGGGDMEVFAALERRGGRSPRGRGRLVGAAGHVVPDRSIPAWAGETSRGASDRAAPRVDPRVGGGDCRTRTTSPGPTGRSPRGRGRHSRPVRAGLGGGSIPAWAGETLRITAAAHSSTVDPRVGGGDPWMAPRPRCRGGRSPRGRGRPQQGAILGGCWGSIPAWAGETPASRRSSTLAMVDPRVGGGDQRGAHTRAEALGRSPRGRGRRPVSAD